MRTSNRRADWVRDCRGFSLAQMVFTVAIISILSGMAVLGFRSSRAAFRLNNSSREFAANLERARLDAIRRHDVANVEFINSTTYEITMDFANNGGKQTRRFTLDPNVVLIKSDGTEWNAAPYPYADFDWRGRTTECSTLFRLRNSLNDRSVVQVAGSGDITVNNSVTALPNVNYVSVNQNADVVPTTVFTGTDTRLNVSPCNSSGSGSTSTTTTVPPPTVTCTSGTLSLSTGYITIRRNGLSSGTATATVNAMGTINLTPDANLSVTPPSQGFTSSSGGSHTFTVTSVTKTRGTFPVKFTFSACSATLYVKVTN